MIGVIINESSYQEIFILDFHENLDDTIEFDILKNDVKFGLLVKIKDLIYFFRAYRGQCIKRFGSEIIQFLISQLSHIHECGIKMFEFTFCYRSCT